MWSTIVYLALLAFLIPFQISLIERNKNGTPNVVIIGILITAVVMSNDMFSLTATFSNNFSLHAYNAPRLQTFIHVILLIGVLAYLLMMNNYYGGSVDREKLIHYGRNLLYTAQQRDKNATGHTAGGKCPLSHPHSQEIGFGKGLLCYRTIYDRDSLTFRDNDICTIDREKYRETCMKDPWCREHQLVGDKVPLTVPDCAAPDSGQYLSVLSELSREVMLGVDHVKGKS